MPSIRSTTEVKGSVPSYLYVEIRQAAHEIIDLLPASFEELIDLPTVVLAVGEAEDRPKRVLATLVPVSPSLFEFHGRVQIAHYPVAA